MNTVDRKARAALIVLLLASGGVAMGALASSLTTDSLVWRAPEQVPHLDGPVTATVDQASAGQAWARSAFNGGLRQCPRMNDAFLAACETEMKKLVERPAFPAGSYGGPLPMPRIEPVAYDRSWEAQERLETPRPTPQPTSDAMRAEPAPGDTAFERTPDNYPAAPQADDPTND